jgi:hypothetical protein
MIIFLFFLIFVLTEKRTDGGRNKNRNSRALFSEFKFKS